MSGSHFLIPPLPLSMHEEIYKQAIAALGLADIPADEKIRYLKEMLARDLASSLPPSVIIVPAIDGDIIEDRPTFDDLANPKNDYTVGKVWCEQLLIGDAQMDVSYIPAPGCPGRFGVPTHYLQGNIIRILMPGAEVGCAMKFIHIIEATLRPYPGIAQRILEQYAISPNVSDEQAFVRILEYFNDIAFFMPTLTAAQGWVGNAFVYYFNQGNSWDGPSNGRAISST